MLERLSPEKITLLITKGKLLVTLLLCAWLANISAQAVWMVVSPEPLPSVAASSSIKVLANKVPKQEYSIVSHLLFGEAPVQAVSVEETVVDAPKTRLRLRLLGVFVGQTPALSTAIISEQGKPDADFFRVGDTVQNGVTLSQVHSDRVILDRKGRLEALYFDDSENLFEAETKAVNTPAKANINSVDKFAQVAKKKFRSNPLSALGSVGFSPVTQGQALGYRFTGKNPMMERYGIQKGDIIRSVNGIDVGDVASDGEQLDQVFEQGQASILVERGSRQFEVTVPLK